MSTPHGRRNMEKAYDKTRSADKNADGKTGGASRRVGENSDKQSTSKQLIAVVFILSLATKMFLLPIYLIQSTGRDAYIVLAVMCAFDLVALAAWIISMRLSPDTDFFTLLSKLIGKVGAKIFVAFVALFYFFKLNVVTTETLTFYSDNVFADFDAAIMIFMLLIFLAAVANHTLRALGRLNELLVPLIVVCILILGTIVVMTGVDVFNVLPAMREPDSFNAALFRHAAWSGDFTPLALFVGRTQMKKHTGKIAMTAGAVGTCVAVFFALVLCAAFGNVPRLIDSSTNITSILQYSIGNVYGRIDLFSSILWSVGAFMETAFFFYCTARCIAFVIGRNSAFWIALGTCVALYCTQIFAMTDPTVFSTVVTSSAASVTVPLFTAAIPLLSLVASMVERHRSRGKRGGHADIKPKKPSRGDGDAADADACENAVDGGGAKR